MVQFYPNFLPNFDPHKLFIRNIYFDFIGHKKKRVNWSASVEKICLLSCMISGGDFMLQNHFRASTKKQLRVKNMISMCKFSFFLPQQFIGEKYLHNIFVFCFWSLRVCSVTLPAMMVLAVLFLNSAVLSITLLCFNVFFCFVFCHGFGTQKSAREWVVWLFFAAVVLWTPRQIAK